MLMAIVGPQMADAQTLVLHLSDGTLVNIDLNKKVRVAFLGDINIITMPDGNTTVQYERNQISYISFEGVDASGNGDVNSDGKVDVADIASIIDIMAGNEQNVGTFTKCPNNNHPHKIDLGLPSGTKWSCCNVGALAPEGYGDLFAWGETKQKDNEYTWETYQHCDGSLYSLHDIPFDITKTAYDAATVQWGSNWCMPTFEQFKELYYNTTALFTSINGFYGMKFTGKNGAYIFLPAAGRKRGDANDELGLVGYYWTSTIDPTYSYRAYYLNFDQGKKLISYEELADGLSVRPIAQ